MKDDLCVVLNCPFYFFPTEENSECVRVSELKSARFNDPVPTWEEDSEEHFLNFAFPGEKVTPGSVNGRKFEYPGINSLFQSNQVSPLNSILSGASALKIQDYKKANVDKTEKYFRANESSS